MTSDSCRLCGKSLQHSFCDLGMSPLSNSYIDADKLKEPELFFPLHAFVCDTCYLVQVKEFQSPAKIFSEYAYFSSYSDSWLKSAKSYAEYAIDRFHLGSSSNV